MRLPRLLAGGAVVALLTGTAACGAEALEPKVALRDAMTAFTSARTGAVELSIPSSADEVLAFAAAADPEGSSDEAIPDDTLQTVLSSSLDVAYDLGEDRESETDDSSSVVVSVGDLVAGEVRSVEEIVYARADLDGLAEKFPEMQEGLGSVRAGLTGEDGFSEPAPATVSEPLTAFLDGEWIALDLEAYLEQMQESAAGQDTGMGTGGMGMSAYASDEIRDLLGTALSDAVTTVERRESDELGDHLVAFLDLRTAYTELRSGLPELFDEATAEGLEQEMPPVTDVPDKDIEISFWLRDGELQRAELDVAQFLDEPAGALVLRADLVAEREISAPDGAVEFDVAAVMGAAVSAAEPEIIAEEGEMFEGVDAFTVATWVDADLAHLAGEAGQPPSVALLPDVLANWGSIEPATALTAVGERVQVEVGPDVVCLTLSVSGTAEDIVPGPC